MTATTVSKLWLVDSSGWFEFVTDGAKADKFAAYLEPEEKVVVPTIVMYEVCKKLRVQLGSHGPDQFLSYAMRRRVVGLDEQTAIAAADISLQHRLHMADAIIYSTSLRYRAELVTADSHFQAVPGVTII